jgi:hypothetical protein
MDKRIPTWNVRTMYRTGSLRTVAERITEYMLDSTGRQEVRWDRGDTQPEGECSYFYGKGNDIHELGTG